MSVEVLAAQPQRGQNGAVYALCPQIRTTLDHEGVGLLQGQGADRHGTEVAEVYASRHPRAPTVEVDTRLGGLEVVLA